MQWQIIITITNVAILLTVYQVEYLENNNIVIVLHENVFVFGRYMLKYLRVKCDDYSNLLSNGTAKKKCHIYMYSPYIYIWFLYT